MNGISIQTTGIGKYISGAIVAGTWTASGTWTIPAVTLGGTVSGGAQAINNVASLLIGATAAYAGRILEINAVSTYGGLACNTWSATSAESNIIIMNRSRAATLGGFTAVASGDSIGRLSFNAAHQNGTASFAGSSYIDGLITGTVGEWRTPGLLRFHLYSDVAYTSPGDSSQDLIILSMTANDFTVATSVANKLSAINRLTISGALATAVATWSNVTHSGLSVTDGQDIVLGTTTGTKIGTATSQKIGFFNVTPVVQQTGYAVPTDLNSCIAALTALRTALNNFGLQTVV